MPRDVIQFLDQYCAAFNCLDGEAVANLYCVPSAIVSDRGLTTWVAREPIVQNMVALCELYRANGYKRATFVPGAFFAQGSAFAVADVAWTIEREDAAEPWRFNTTYNLQQTPQGWRVVLCTAYDEKRLSA